MSEKLLNKTTSAQGEVLLYQTEDGATRIEVRFKGETVWLSLKQLVELFQRDKSVISRHIRNIFEEGELPRDRVVANFATTAADGKVYQVESAAATAPLAGNTNVLAAGRGLNGEKRVLPLKGGNKRLLSCF